MSDDVKEIIQALIKWNDTTCNGNCNSCKLHVIVDDLIDEEGYKVDACDALIKVYEKLMEDDENE